MTKHNHRGYVCSKCVHFGYVKGQAELIEKLTSEEVKIETWKYFQGQIDKKDIGMILIKASESAKAMKSSKTVGKEPVSCGENPRDAPEKPCAKCKLLSSAMDKPTLCPDCEEAERNKPEKLCPLCGFPKKDCDRIRRQRR